MIEGDDNLGQIGFRLGNQCARASHRRPQPGNRRTGDPSFHRGGAVAHMPRIPVATMRVWERRHGLTQAELSPSGHRLHSADNVRRLAWVEELTDLGHAIGSLAPLDMPQPQRVATTHARAPAATQKGERSDAAHLPPVRAWRLAVIGAAMGPGCSGPRCCAGMASPCCRWGRSTRCGGRRRVADLGP